MENVNTAGHNNFLGIKATREKNFAPPNPIIKKPIFAIIKGETSKLVTENSLGVCANPSDINDIAKKFMTCIDLDELTINKFSSSSERLLKTTFNKECIMNKMTDILIGKE